jgi:hypothetical protein
MSDNEKIEKVLERFEPGRREAMRKILVGAALYAAPVVASFSLDTLGGVAQAAGPNQTQLQNVPATSGKGLFGLMAVLGVIGAFMARFRRR